jgi:hypothetical protein
MNGNVLSELTHESYRKIDDISDNYVDEYEDSILSEIEQAINENGTEDENV